MTFDPQPLYLTLKLGLLTTAILLAACLPTASWLAHAHTSVRVPLRALVNMPLVLPPTVLGFYLLLLFSPAFGLGRFLDQVLHVRLVFSFAGLVIASLVFSLPFMINPLVAGFESLPRSLAEASYVLGKSRRQTLTHVLLPNIRPALLTGIVMTFAHTIGEFGVVLMIGGKIPGVTQVASIAVYDEVESLHYAAANTYALVLVLVSFTILTALFVVNRNSFRPF